MLRSDISRLLLAASSSSALATRTTLMKGGDLSLIKKLDEACQVGEQ